MLHHICSGLPIYLKSDVFQFFISIILRKIYCVNGFFWFNFRGVIKDASFVIRFAYVEFCDEAAVPNAVLLNDTVFRGRQLKGRCSLFMCDY